MRMDECVNTHRFNRLEPSLFLAGHPRSSFVCYLRAQYHFR
jgi:hypothetical protein